MNRRHRLRGRARITAVRSGGAGGRSSGIRVRALPNGASVSRAAFAIGGRSGAVQRNHARRRLRAAVEPLLRDVPGFDVLVSVRPMSPEQPFAQLVEGLASAFREAVSRVQG